MPRKHDSAVHVGRGKKASTQAAEGTPIAGLDAKNRGMRLSTAMPNFELVDDRTEKLGFAGPSLMEAFVETINRRPEAMRSNRTTGMALILLTEVLGYTQAAAYRLVRPNHGASDESAAAIVRKIKAHYRKNYPLSINEALEVHGITIERIIGDIKAEMSACKTRWNSKKETWETTEVPDYPTRRHARAQLLKIVEMDKKARQELAVGKAEMQKMQLNTGPEFDTIEEWQAWMESQHEITMKERAEAARDMRLIAAGRQIIQEKGQKAADEYRQAALEAGMTGEEPFDDEADAADGVRSYDR